MRLSLGPDFVDEHDARVEIALLAGDPLIDRVGDDMADAPRVLGPGEELLAGELLAGEHVPQPELGLEPAVGGADAADDQRLRVDHPPIVEARHAVGADALLDEGRLVDRHEQSRGAQIARHHVGDLARGLRRRSSRRRRNRRMAIGSGWMVPCVMLSSTTARAGLDASERAKPSSDKRQRAEDAAV